MTRHVLLTRDASRCAGLVGALERQGVRVTVAPALRIETLEAGVEAATAAVPMADRVLFTSANGVRAMAGAELPPTWCVGRATAEAAREAGHEVEHVGEGGLADLVGALGADVVSGRSLLWPGGNLVDERVVAPWREDGAAILAVPVYATASAYDEGQAPVVHDVDDVVFASPSAALFLVDALGEMIAAELKGRARAVAIGGTTEAALQADGWAHVVRSASPDDAGLLAALITP